MIKKIFSITLFISFFLIFTFPALAQSPTQEVIPPVENYYKAEVVEIVSETRNDTSEFGSYTQTIKVKFLDGPRQNDTIEVENTASVKLAEEKEVSVGDKLVILETVSNDSSSYSVFDKYRLNYIYFIIIAFFALIIIFAGIKGIGSILGMLVSLGVLLIFIVPQILNGHNPLLITIIGSTIILFTTIFLAHGVSKKTSSAVASTVIALSLTGILSFTVVKLMNLTGLGNEQNYLLQIGNLDINAQGLLLSGIIIGSLGVLDDVTTTQSAAIFEFLKIDKKLSITDLFVKGYSVGKDHIASLVNTLILAYAGASLGLFALFVLNPNNMPAWVMLNDEMIVEEVVRAIVGSVGLILAVPITTIIASVIAKRFNS